MSPSNTVATCGSYLERAAVHADSRAHHRRKRIPISLPMARRSRSQRRYPATRMSSSCLRRAVSRSDSRFIRAATTRADGLPMASVSYSPPAAARFQRRALIRICGCGPLGWTVRRRRCSRCHAHSPARIPPTASASPMRRSAKRCSRRGGRSRSPANGGDTAADACSPFASSISRRSPRKSCRGRTATTAIRCGSATPCTSSPIAIGR